ncbi:MAG: ERCC4 domain-containing protein [Nanoarchaeota archaeon]
MEKEKITIIADIREKYSGVIKALYDEGVLVELKALPTADFLCSSRVAVEVKRSSDFVNSIIDGRLLRQLKELKENFEKPILMIEGNEEQDLYSIRNVHPNAIRGMLAAIAVSYGIPILYSKNPKDTAGLLIAIAKREMDANSPQPSLHPQKPATLSQQQEYVIASLPGIEVKLAKSLLQKFGSVADIMNSSEEQLQKVELIGPKKAAEIRKVIDSEYR